MRRPEEELFVEVADAALAVAVPPAPAPEVQETKAAETKAAETKAAETKAAETKPRRSLLRYLAMGPFILAHLLAIAGVIYVGVSVELVALALGLYVLRMFFITAAYHRYFAHRSFKTSRPFQFLLALGGTTAAQRGVLWWAGHHRDHHRYSDTPQDLHSPIQTGFLWSHVGWFLDGQNDPTPFDKIRDFEKYPELRWLNRNWLVPPLAGLVGLYLVAGLPWAVWGGLVSTVLLWHGTFTINSLSHIYGSRRFQTTDTSKNNPLLALITLGEGWHNNHHYFAASANQGFYWYELDVSFLVLRVLEKMRLVWDLKRPPESVLELGRQGPGAVTSPSSPQETSSHI
jgi:stearoyl-CoA desaturase (delta-9 desaturase)